MKFSDRLGWPLPANPLSRLRTETYARKGGILDFSESNPARAGLSAPVWSRFTEMFSDPTILEYDPDPRGMSRCRDMLAARFQDRGFWIDPSRIFLGASTSEAYGWLFKLLCDPGDAILVPRPGYPLFEYLAGLEAVRTIPYRLEYTHPSGWTVDLDRLASVLERDAGSTRVKCIVLINPNNPTGSYIGAEEREAIIELCLRHGLAIISDEVFYDFALDAPPDRKSFAGEDKVLCFTLDGLSKLAGLPGFKLAWTTITGPADTVSEASGRLEVIADSYLSAGTPVMTALPKILAGSRAFVDSARGRMRENLDILHRNLEGPDSPHRVLRCGGGWTALLQSPRFESEEELARRLLVEEGVWIHPGYFFDMEKEAFFAASLIAPPEKTTECVRRYASMFTRIMEGRHHDCRPPS